MQTLNEYIFSKATNKRPPASPADSSSTLTGYITQKVQGGEKSRQSFEEQLDKAFQMLGKKTAGIKREQFKQITIATNLLEKQQDAQKLIADILNLTEERTVLEKQFYQRIVEGQEPLEPQSVQEEPATVEEPEPQEEEQESGIQKLAAGGTTQVTTPTKESKDITEKDKQIKFADTMQLQPKASGISAVSVLGEFLSALGPLAGFFRPYVKNIATPFAISMGVSQSIINTLLGGPVQAGELKTKEYQKDFGKTWSKFLNDENFISLFIDKVDRFIQQELLTGPPGTGTDFWTLAAVAALEDGRAQGVADVAQSVYNRLADGAYGKSVYDILTRDGQYQVAFVDPTASRGAGTRIADIWKSIKDADSAAAAIMYYYQKRGQSITKEQAKQKAESAAKALQNPSLRKEAAAFVQGRTDFTASASGSDVVERPGGGNAFYWAYGTGKMRGKPAAPIPSFSMGGAMGDNRSPLMPYLLSGPEAGYDVSIQGYKVTMHGDEIVEPFENGFRVFPVKNRRYDVTENPEEVIDRWKQIAGGESIKIAGTAQGGGSKRSSRKVSSLAKDYKYWELFYSRQAAYSQIGTSRQGTSGTGYAPSIVSRWLASEQRTRIASRSYSPSVKPVKTETDVLMDQYKALIADGKHSEAKDLGMKIWNKTWRKTSKGLERIPSKPAPKATAAHMVSASSSSEKSPKIIINNLPSTNQPPSIQAVPSSSKSMIVPIPVVNYQRLRTELNMKRTK